MFYKSQSHDELLQIFAVKPDIETNPYPAAVDLNKTIVTPYSQGNNIAVFGHNVMVGDNVQLCVCLSTLEETVHSWSLLGEDRGNWERS